MKPSTPPSTRLGFYLSLLRPADIDQAARITQGHVKTLGALKATNGQVVAASTETPNLSSAEYQVANGPDQPQQE